ncbi:LacI family DNA-binding transcriptional regulator [Saccharothrix sp. MB29]|nr:LacI family DNA-binding transcriptional regulator [Saccharothrix sp. MB29]
MGRRRVTLADVAAASGVSSTTASLILSGRARELRISEEAERRVRANAQELGYRRNTPSVGLRTGRTRRSASCPTPSPRPAFAGNMIKGAVDAAHRRGSMLFVGESGATRRSSGRWSRPCTTGRWTASSSPPCTRSVAVPEGLGDGPPCCSTPCPRPARPSPRCCPTRCGRAARPRGRSSTPDTGRAST